MFEKMKTGIALTKQSFKIISNRKRFLLFPLMTSLLVFICFLALLVAAFSTLSLEDIHQLSQHQNGIISAAKTTAGKTTLSLLTILFIFLSSFISTIINSALTISTIKYLQDETMTFCDSFKAVFSHTARLFFWACIVTVIDVLMFGIESLISKKSNLAGNIVGGLERTAWSIISFFILPIMMVENIGPIDAIKRSGALLKKNWGTALVSSAGIGLIMLLLFIVIFTPPSLMIYFGHTTFLLKTIVICIILFSILLIFNATLKTILKAALYLYAAGKSPDKFYDKQLLSNAFKAGKDIR